MGVLRSVHLGVILHNDIIVKILIDGKKSKLLRELNNWFFDYFKVRKEEILQLPPLDDWEHASEDSSFWQCHFPDDTWKIWIRTDIVEFS